MCKRGKGRAMVVVIRLAVVVMIVVVRRLQMDLCETELDEVEYTLTP